MKSFTTAQSIVAFLLALLILIMPGSSLETSVLITAEHNLSIDIGPEYVLGSRTLAQSDDGNSYQTIVINNSRNGNATNATLLIFSIPLYAEDLAKMNSTPLSEFFEDTMLGIFKLAGEDLVGEQFVNNKMGENVTLHSFIESESEREANGDAYSVAIWPIDSRNMIMLLSYLDDTTNKQIIESLAVESANC
ncbi:MAG: hypothetical protein ACP5OM_02330 [Methanothrix sp.]